MPRKSRSTRGMTLIEIMVVITIIGVLGAAVAVTVVERLNDAKVERAKMDLRALHSNLTAFYVKTGKYPAPEEGLEALVKARLIDVMPKDPWGHPYLYRLEAGVPLIESHGNDGAPGGQEHARDLTSMERGD